jgi:GNAT superfamily N-acetyltransferase
MKKVNPVSSENSIRIRMGKTADLEAVFELVKELAEYEEALDEVTTSVPYYRKQFELGVFSFFVAEKNAEIIGMMVFYDAFSTWKGKMLWLEDFLVSEKHRKTGVGSKLFNHLIHYAKNNDYKLIKWEVLDWNEPAINFYKKVGARLETNWWDGKYLL